ncbi:MAG: DnaJ domain-containing protein [Armatimonadia bacterium]
MNTELYQILGIAPDATPEDIKAAYREKAKRWHPDLGGNEAAFQKLQKAYVVLSDPDERAYYDRTGRADRAKADAIEEQARGFFANILVAVLDNPHAGRMNVLQEGVNQARAERRKINNTIAELEAKTKRIDDLTTRFKAKDGKSTMPQDIYATVRRQITDTIEQHKDRLAVLDRLEKMLDEYDYEAEHQALPYWFSEAASSTNWRP